MSLPITLYLDGRLALIVGGGTVAARKAAALAEAGARLRIVAPAFDARLAQMPDVEFVARAYDARDLDGAALAIAATGDSAVNAAVVADARERGILAADASEPERGDFAMPAVTRIGNVSVAIETGGAAPSLGKRLAGDVRELLGEHVGAAAQTLHRMRTYVKTVLPQERRADVLRALAELPLELLARMNPVEAEHEVEAAISRLSGAEPAATQAAVCATRASQLAMTQTRAVAAKLAQQGIATTLLTVTTTGDRVQDRALTAIGAESLFVKELELALRDGRADYAVHSCKDLPTQLPPDMRIAAISSREDPRDAYCSERFATFDDLPPGSIVGTSSLRRRAQLAALRGDLDYRDIRGNVDTRLRKLRDGAYDAIVLASAGLRRLNASARYTVPFEPDRIVPAVAQGALAVEVAAGSTELAQHLRDAINDAKTELTVLCERAALRSLQGGCQAPIGIYAEFDGDTLTVRGAVATLDGKNVVRALQTATVTDVDGAERLGCALAAALRDGGAQAVLAVSPRPHGLPLAGRTAALPRTQDRPSRIAERLRGDGADVVEMREGETYAGDRLPDIVVFASSASVAAATGLLATLRERQCAPLIAAMGPASASAARSAGFPPQIVAPEASVDALASAIRAYVISMETETS